MEGTEKKKVSGWAVAIFFAVLVTVILHFPLIDYKGKKIVMFAFEPLREILEGNFIRGRVIGSHTLETEYGEIRLKSLSLMSAQENRLYVVRNESFRIGRATHNLVVKGIEIPKYIGIVFDYENDQKIDLLSIYGQEITISEIYLSVERIFLKLKNNTTGIMISGNYLPEEITLTDSTQMHLNLQVPGWDLYIIDEYPFWIINIGFSDRNYFLVKLPGETEFKKYTSITFSKDWGGFIEGVLFEEGE